MEKLAPGTSRTRVSAGPRCNEAVRSRHGAGMVAGRSNTGEKYPWRHTGTNATATTTTTAPATGTAHRRVASLAASAPIPAAMRAAHARTMTGPTRDVLRSAPNADHHSTTSRHRRPYALGCRYGYEPAPTTVATTSSTAK